MNFFCKALLAVGLFVVQNNYAGDLHVYRAEYEALKTSPQYRLLVDDEASDSLRGICRDIENYQELTRFQRFVRSTFMSLDSFVVTPRTMPKLYAYIDTMCKEQKIATPTIFVSTLKGFFNAAAQKLLTSSGAIIIGEKLLLDASDKELEAVVAHEIGHIKHNHINKMLAINCLAFVPAIYLARAYFKAQPTSGDFKRDMRTAGLNTYKRFIFANLMANTLTALYVNKRYEKEADAFAYKTMHKGEGLVEFFKQLEQKIEARETHLSAVSDALVSSKTKLGMYDYMRLNLRYYLAKAGKRLGDAYLWFYFNTPFGAHPSCASRIKAAQEYMTHNV